MSESAVIANDLCVSLSAPEMACAAYQGCQRRLRRVFGCKSVDRYGWNESGDAWGIDIEAVAAEMVFAKWRNIYWRPSPLPDHDGDVGSYQVRWTAHENGGLIVYERNRDEQVFVLVSGKEGRYRLCGWMYAHDCKKAEWAERARQLGFRGNPYPFIVPQDSLNTMAELP